MSSAVFSTMAYLNPRGDYARAGSESFTIVWAEEADPPQVWKGIPSRGDRLDDNLLIAQRFCLALGMPPRRCKEVDSTTGRRVSKSLAYLPSRVGNGETSAARPNKEIRMPRQSRRRTRRSIMTCSRSF